MDEKPIDLEHNVAFSATLFVRRLREYLLFITKCFILDLKTVVCKTCLLYNFFFQRNTLENEILYKTGHIEKIINSVHCESHYLLLQIYTYQPCRLQLCCVFLYYKY